MYLFKRSVHKNAIKHKNREPITPKVFSQPHITPQKSLKMTVSKSLYVIYYFLLIIIIWTILIFSDAGHVTVGRTCGNDLFQLVLQ